MLLLGGPAHGQERDLDNGQTEIVVMAPSPGNPVPMPFTYKVREIEAETRPGLVFRRTVLVEKNMPVEIATQGLAQILLVRFSEELVRQFMEGGELVVDDSENMVRGSRPSDGGENQSGGTSGLVIAKR